nr:hypothetical protein [Tanacetum cinerariifolium]GEX93964.1 hypothetical protein [Tanacetum cinerariifolium]
MSDSKDSTVTYTKVSSPFEDLSVIGSQGVVVYGYEGLPMHLPSPGYVPGPEQPSSPDYVPGPEHPPLPVYVPYVLEPAYPVYMPHEDDALPAVSPTADSPGYITKSNLEEDKDEDEEEKHLAPSDSVPPPSYRTTARMSIRAQTSIPFSFKIPSLPLPASSTHLLGYRATMIRLRAESPSTSYLLPLSPHIILLHTRASMAIMRAATPSTYILAPRLETPLSGTPPVLPIPLRTSSPPLLLPSTNRRADVPEVTLPPWKRLCIAIEPRFEVEECLSAHTARPTGGFRADYSLVGTMDAEIRHCPDRDIGYKITDVWEDPDKIVKEIPTTDVAELSLRMTNFVTTVRHDTYEIYRRLDDSEARASCKAWAQSMDACDMTRSETQLDALQSQQRPARDPTHADVPEEDSSVVDSLAARDADRSQNSEDGHDSGTGVRRQAPLARENCVPYKQLNCGKQIKFATCTLLGSALTWWNSYVNTIGYDVSYAMTWTNLKKKMTDKYCPRGEIKKLEELALMCTRMFLEESDKIKRYVGGLPDMIHESVMTSKPKTMQDAVEFATQLMDMKIRTFAERQTENKRKSEDSAGKNQNQQ